MRDWRWAEPRLFLIGAVGYLIYNFVKFVTFKKFQEWDQVFVFAARRLRQGIDIYSPGTTQEQLWHPHTYPPFQALAAVPFSFLPMRLSQLIFVLICEAALVALWRVAWRISGGKRLGNGRLNWREAAICAVGIFPGMRYVQGCFGHQQTDVIIASLLVCGCFYWSVRRDILAATFWGVAAAMKGPPLLLAPYLAWRGRWMAAMWMTLLAVGLNLAPELVARPAHGIWLTQWYDTILKPKDDYVGQWYVDVILNQSLAGAAYRNATTSWRIVPHELKVTRHPPVIAPKTMMLMLRGIEVAMLAGAIWAMGRPFRRPASAHQAVLEASVVFILALLFSPMSHRTHFGILILPGLLVTRLAIEGRNRACIWATVACFILIGLMDRNFFGQALGDLFAWYGNVTLGTIALGIGCCAALVQLRKMPAGTTDNVFLAQASR
jgi:hypothetical protein